MGILILYLSSCLHQLKRNALFLRRKINYISTRETTEDTIEIENLATAHHTVRHIEH